MSLDDLCDLIRSGGDKRKWTDFSSDYDGRRLIDVSGADLASVLRGLGAAPAVCHTEWKVFRKREILGWTVLRQTRPGTNETQAPEMVSHVFLDEGGGVYEWDARAGTYAIHPPTYVLTAARFRKMVKVMQVNYGRRRRRR